MHGAQQGTYLYLWPSAGPLYGYQGFGDNCSSGWPFCTQSCTLLTTCSQVGPAQNPSEGGGSYGTCASVAFTSTVAEAACSNGTGANQGAWLSLSANEGMPGTGIIWAVTGPDWNGSGANPTLHAFAALDLGTELWNSEMNSSDSLIAAPSPYSVPKFTVPLVANGRVFVPTTGGGAYGPVVQVYGLKGR